MPFPGWAALLPVVGSALVLLGGLPPRMGGQPSWPSRLLGVRPLRSVGDVSYSLYLWHWPVIVFFVFEVHRPPTKLEAPTLALLSLALAALSTRFVERPFRMPRPGASGAMSRARPRRRAFALAAALLTISLSAGAVPWLYILRLEGQLAGQQLDAQHPGATGPLPAALPRAGTVSVIPDPAVARSDIPLVNRQRDCAAFDPRKGNRQGCVYGEKDSKLSVVLVGDSHAGQFSTSLAKVASTQGWALHTMVRNGCPFTAAPQLINGAVDRDCEDANLVTRDAILALHPRLVVTSAMTPEGYESALGWSWASQDELVQGYRELWRPLVRAGIGVVVIRDTPNPGKDSPGVRRAGGADLRDEPRPGGGRAARSPGRGGERGSRCPGARPQRLLLQPTGVPRGHRQRAGLPRQPHDRHVQPQPGPRPLQETRRSGVIISSGARRSPADYS